MANGAARERCDPDPPSCPAEFESSRRRSLRSVRTTPCAAAAHDGEPPPQSDAFPPKRARGWRLTRRLRWSGAAAPGTGTRALACESERRDSDAVSPASSRGDGPDRPPASGEMRDQLSGGVSAVVGALLLKTSIVVPLAAAAGLTSRLGCSTSLRRGVLSPSGDSAVPRAARTREGCRRSTPALPPASAAFPSARASALHSPSASPG
jgi:hypothetical protein